MTGFGIAFTGEFDASDPLVAIGRLTLGEDQERFDSTLTFWGIDDYAASWAAGLRRVLDGAEVSCLATSVTDPETSNFVEVWPLYRSGEEVRVQNRILFLDQLTTPFLPEAPWNSLGPRETVTEDGDPVSEWLVPVADITTFLEPG